MNPDEQRIVERQAELTAWLSEEAGGFPVLSITPKAVNMGTLGRVYLKEVQMGMIILTSEVTLPEDKIRARFRVELGKILEQPA
jgi:hypothetical protein